MVDSRHGASDGLVLLDEWHVGLFVDETLSAALIEEVRWLFDAELAAWGRRFVSELRAAGLVRVDVGQ